MLQADLLGRIHVCAKTEYSTFNIVVWLLTCTPVEVAFISVTVYFKNARSLAGSVMNCQEGLEVAAVKFGLCR